jgi:cytochrome o ubiquinol oxidase subunit IV
MNVDINDTSHTKDEHGSVKSYVVGFILSLIFTAIPYYLVVNKTVSGTAIASIILGFALLQMLVQVFFFLHLGRGPKPAYNVVFFAATFGLILVVVGGSMFIIKHLNYNMSPIETTKYLAQKEGIDQLRGKATGACQEIHTNHQVVINGGQATPVKVIANLCDSLTFINHNDEITEITFGLHPSHGTYAGNSEVAVRKGRNETITLNQLGTYQFHDHLNPLIFGEFTVNDLPEGADQY